MSVREAGEWVLAVAGGNVGVGNVGVGKLD